MKIQNNIPEEITVRVLYHEEDDGEKFIDTDEMKNDFNSQLEEVDDAIMRDNMEREMESSMSTEERMNGLVNSEDVLKLMNLKREIRADLIKSGFDDDDVSDYIDRRW